MDIGPLKIMFVLLKKQRQCWVFVCLCILVNASMHKWLNKNEPVFLCESYRFRPIPINHTLRVVAGLCCPHRGQQAFLEILLLTDNNNKRCPQKAPFTTSCEETLVKKCRTLSSFWPLLGSRSGEGRRSRERPAWQPHVNNGAGSGRWKPSNGLGFVFIRSHTRPPQ